MTVPAQKSLQKATGQSAVDQTATAVQNSTQKSGDATNLSRAKSAQKGAAAGLAMDDQANKLTASGKSGKLGQGVSGSAGAKEDREEGELSSDDDKGAGGQKAGSAAQTKILNKASAGTSQGQNLSHLQQTSSAMKQGAQKTQAINIASPSASLLQKLSMKTAQANENRLKGTQGATPTPGVQENDSSYDSLDEVLKRRRLAIEVEATKAQKNAAGAEGAGTERRNNQRGTFGRDMQNGMGGKNGGKLQNNKMGMQFNKKEGFQAGYGKQGQNFNNQRNGNQNNNRFQPHYQYGNNSNNQQSNAGYYKNPNQSHQYGTNNSSQLNNYGNNQFNTNSNSGGPQRELCKFYLTNTCHRGPDCTFSHNTHEFPCKYLHGTGQCQKNQDCRFKHDLMSSPEEINRFMRDNEDFLKRVLEETGKTNLNQYFLLYLKEKEENEKRAKEPKDLMLPPSLTKSMSDNLNSSDQNNRVGAVGGQGANLAGNNNNNGQEQTVQSLLNTLQQLLINDPSLQYNPAAIAPLNALKQIQAFLATQTQLLGTNNDPAAQSGANVSNQNSNGVKKSLTQNQSPQAQQSSQFVNQAKSQLQVVLQQLRGISQSQVPSPRCGLSPLPFFQSPIAMTPAPAGISPSPMHHLNPLGGGLASPPIIQRINHFGMVHQPGIGQPHIHGTLGSGSGLGLGLMSGGGPTTPNPLLHTAMMALSPNSMQASPSPARGGVTVGLQHYQPGNLMMVSPTTPANPVHANQLSGQSPGTLTPSMQPSMASGAGSAMTGGGGAAQDPRLRPPPFAVAQQEFQPKTRVEQDIENWKQQQQIQQQQHQNSKKHKSGFNSNQNQNTNNNGSGSILTGSFGQTLAGQATQGMNAVSAAAQAAMAQDQKKKRRRKRNKKRIKSYLSSSSNSGDEGAGAAPNLNGQQSIQNHFAPLIISGQNNAQASDQHHQQYHNYGTGHHQNMNNNAHGNQMGGMFTAGQGGMGNNGSGHDLISSCSSMSYSDYEEDDSSLNPSNEGSANPNAQASSVAGAQCLSSAGKRGGDMHLGLPKAPYKNQGINHLRLLLAERGHLAWIKFNKDKEKEKEAPMEIGQEQHQDENKEEMEEVQGPQVNAPGEDIEMKE